MAENTQDGGLEHTLDWADPSRSMDLGNTRAAPPRKDSGAGLENTLVGIESPVQEESDYSSGGVDNTLIDEGGFLDPSRPIIPASDDASRSIQEKRNQGSSRSGIAAVLYEAVLGADGKPSYREVGRAPISAGGVRFGRSPDNEIIVPTEAALHQGTLSSATCGSGRAKIYLTLALSKVPHYSDYFAVGGTYLNGIHLGSQTVGRIPISLTDIIGLGDQLNSRDRYTWKEREEDIIDSDGTLRLVKGGCSVLKPNAPDPVFRYVLRLEKVK